MVEIQGSLSQRDESPPNSEFVPGPQFYARFGTVYCLVQEVENTKAEPHDKPDGGMPRLPDGQDVVAAVARQLGEDARVLRVKVPKDNFISFHSVFPTLQLDPLDPAPQVDDMLEWALEFAVPIRFQVSVPKKNQPGWTGDDASIAADTYFCTWDGSMLVVLWESADRAPHLGGQVARDIVVEAIDRAGYNSRLQGPSLAHVDVRVTCDPDAGSFEARRLDWQFVDLTLPSPTQAAEAVVTLHDAARFVVHEYYEVENAHETFRQVMWLTEFHIQTLLRLQHRRANARILHIRQRMREYWNLIGTRAGLRDLVAKILLELAILREIRDTYLTRLRNYQDATRNWGLGVLFDNVVRRDQETVKGEEFHFAQSAIDHVAGRLDSRDVVLASLWGVLAGALLGVFGTILASGL